MYLLMYLKFHWFKLGNKTTHFPDFLPLDLSNKESFLSADIESVTLFIDIDNSLDSWWRVIDGLIAILANISNCLLVIKIPFLFSDYLKIDGVDFSNAYNKIENDLVVY